MVGSSFEIGNSLEVYKGLGVKGNIDVSGSIIPTTFGHFDLGSSTFPFRDLHILTSSIRFYDSQGEVGKIQFTRDEGMQVKQVADSQDTTDEDIEYEEDVASSFSATTGSFAYQSTGVIDCGFF